MTVYPLGPVLGVQNFASYWFYYFMHFYNFFSVQMSLEPKGMAGVALSGTLQSWIAMLSPEWAAKNVLSHIRGCEIFLCALQQV